MRDAWRAAIHSPRRVVDCVARQYHHLTVTKNAAWSGSLAGVHVCSGVFYSCAAEVSHHEPLIEKKFGIKV